VLLFCWRHANLLDQHDRQKLLRLSRRTDSQRSWRLLRGDNADDQEIEFSDLAEDQGNRAFRPDELIALDGLLAKVEEQRRGVRL
jgi:hypothetical protein